MEIAISIPIFLTMVIALMDFTRVMYRGISYQFVVTRLAREAAIGETPAATPLDTIEQAKIRAEEIATGIGINFGESHFFICQFADHIHLGPPPLPQGPGFCDMASPVPLNLPPEGHWMLVEIEQEVDVLLGFDSIKVYASAIGRREI